jgi:hypothetical protein
VARIEAAGRQRSSARDGGAEAGLARDGGVEVRRRSGESGTMDRLRRYAQRGHDHRAGSDPSGQSDGRRSPGNDLGTPPDERRKRKGGRARVGEMG